MTRSFYAKNNVSCCMTEGSNSSGDEDTILLGYDVVSVGKELPVFLRSFLPPYTNLQTLHTRKTGSSCQLLYGCMYDNLWHNFHWQNDNRKYSRDSKKVKFCQTCAKQICHCLWVRHLIRSMETESFNNTTHIKKETNALHPPAYEIRTATVTNYSATHVTVLTYYHTGPTYGWISTLPHRIGKDTTQQSSRDLRHPTLHTITGQMNGKSHYTTCNI